MFTGLIEKTTKIEKIFCNEQGAKIFFKADYNDIKIGDSIAVNGVCLTITSIENDLFSADIMFETFNLTNLKTLKAGDIINLERAMTLNNRLDGHLVSGHVDCIATVESIQTEGFSKRIKFNCDSTLIIQKGSITINGISLTVTNVYKNGFEISLIPQTIENTNLKNIKINDKVNIEYDLIGKYIYKFINKKEEEEKFKITEEYLKDHGF